MILRKPNLMEPRTLPPSSVAAIAEDRFRTDSHTALPGIFGKVERRAIVPEGRLSTFL